MIKLKNKQYYIKTNGRRCEKCGGVFKGDKVYYLIKQNKIVCEACIKENDNENI